MPCVEVVWPGGVMFVHGENSCVMVSVLPSGVGV